MTEFHHESHEIQNINQISFRETQVNKLNLNKINPSTLTTEHKMETQTERIVHIERTEEDSKNKKENKKTTIFGAALIITNICLGTTIFTFAVRAKSFGLIWLLFFCFIVAIINYAAVMWVAHASSKCKESDYSEITEKLLGRKIHNVLNIVIIVDGYVTLMAFISLVYSTFGRFIQSAFYKDDYLFYENFENDKWGKMYIKLPFFVGLSVLVALLCLITNMAKLDFASFIGVGAVSYALIVVMVQCHSYYKHYKETVYVENDSDTHPNWYNLGDAFHKDLIFFRGVTNLLFAYACQSGMFPLYEGFKKQNEDGDKGIKKMRMSAILGIGLTTVLNIISIVCSFLTDPVTPEDLVIYRRNKGNGKDIFMIIARLLVSISLFFTIPTYYFTLRLSVVNVFTKGKLTMKFNVLFTFISVFASAIIAALYDKILNYLSYIGFTTALVAYVFPAILYVKSTGKKMTHWLNILVICLAIVIFIFSLINVVTTVIDDINGK